MERELVTKRQWLTAADVTEALTYTKLMTGNLQQNCLRCCH
jgi:hypothetical protein